MKKLLLLFAILLFSTVSLFAQNYREAVYLKNGSIIKGVIIEQVPDASLKIQTSDGSLFVYKMSEVEKITKEVVEASRLEQFNKKSARGYRGFVETGYSIGTGDYSVDRLEIFTTHGYQFNPYIFLGAGLGMSYFNNSDRVTVPIYTDFRVNFTKNKITPFGEVKLGYSSGDVEGSFFSTDLGVRFGLVGKKAINVKLGYTVQGTDFSYSSYNYSYSSTEALQAISLKVGFEF